MCFPPVAAVLVQAVAPMLATPSKTTTDGEDRNRDREESSERFVGRAHVPGESSNPFRNGFGGWSPCEDVPPR